MMGIFGFFRQPDVNRGVEAYHSPPDAVLVDVRSGGEYREGHIPGAINMPLPKLEGIAAVVPSYETPLFVYCYSGARSAQATDRLQRMGYQNVQNIGGIAAWKGDVER